MSTDAPAVSLRQLQYLVAVADTGGFRRAAEACHVSQPALSAQVALAEQQLGVQVFERDRRQVRLSPRGSAVVEQARRVLLAASELQALTRQLADPLQGTLRLGIIPTVGPYLLPEITPVLSDRFPRLTLQWTESRTSDLVHAVKGGALDAILVALEADLGDLHVEPLARDPFVVAAAPTHPINKGAGPATPALLEGAHVLLLDDGHCFREQALRICSKAGATEHSFRATSLATLVQMVSVSSGITLLPSMALPVENRRSQLRIRKFAAPGPGRTIGLAWRRGSPMETTIRALAEAIRPAIGQGGEGGEPVPVATGKRLRRIGLPASREP